MKLCGSCGHRFSGEAMFCPFDGAKLEKVAYDPLGDPLLGSTVDGRYEVMELLGEGGMGRVYEVRHVALDRRFAMKVLRRDLARDEELAARFIQEAKATASVRHPNVVEITDFGRMPDGVPYFVMELLVGETLGHVIKSGGPIPSKRAVRILKQVTSALAAAHTAGIVHRDLKPDNVFLIGGAAGSTAREDVRLVDFGAAKIVGSSRVTRAGIVFGTPHYMSPSRRAGSRSTTGPTSTRSASSCTRCSRGACPSRPTRTWASSRSTCSCSRRARARCRLLRASSARSRRSRWSASRRSRRTGTRR